MSGVGLPELLVIVAIIAILFGAPVLTFFVGYLVGKGRSSADGATAASTTAPTAAPSPAPTTDSQTPPVPPVSESPAPTAEEPEDE